ncbi:MAG TPA: hypothetical protein VM912_21060 [Terriglobales bacterium]|nr:hypothetical protein [Terriglobales bacterium]
MPADNARELNRPISEDFHGSADDAAANERERYKKWSRTGNRQFADAEDNDSSYVQRSDY